MQKHQGSCHCGNVKFEVEGDFKNTMSCNCSMCQRKGTLLAFVPEEQFHLISGEKSLKDYQFGKKMIHHTFCSNCGVTAFASGQTPKGDKMKAVNVCCLDGINIKDLNIKEIDGRSF